MHPLFDPTIHFQKFPKKLLCTTHRLRKQTRGEGWGEGIVREFAIDMYTLLYLKWITRDFPGGAVVKTPRSQCRGPGFNPWSGN